MTDWRPDPPGKSTLLGFSMLACANGVNRRQEENGIAQYYRRGGEVEDNWVHTVLGLKVSGRYFILKVRKNGDV